MGVKVAIGLQSFENIRENNIFYVDKTDFIKDWWEMKDSVTLITRPRRFGKTLNMSMTECFFLITMGTERIFLKGFPYGRRKVIENYRERSRYCF